MKTAQSAITRVLASIGIGILLYFVVGFGGCVVRMVGIGNRWIESDSGGEAFYSYVKEAVIAFFFVIAIGVFSALKTLFEPQLSANTNKSIAFGVKAGLIAFPLAVIIVFGFAGFSSETKTESKTGRFYTVVNPSGINLKGNHYSKNDTIEILEETENAICLKLPSGRECFPTPFVLQKTGKTNIRTLLDDGNVNTKTVQNKQVVTSGMSAFLGNLFVTLLITFIAAISTIFISNYISSTTVEQQTGLGLNVGGSQTNYSPSQNNVQSNSNQEKIMEEKEYLVGMELMNGKITSSSSLEDREKFPFGEDEFNDFFQHFVKMRFIFPKDYGCILIYDAKENHPKHSYGIGWIFAENFDELNNYLNRGDLPKILGEITFEYGGTLLEPRITVKNH